MLKEKLMKMLSEKTARSAWDRGVLAYAVELAESLPDEIESIGKSDLLLGAGDWKQYSYGCGSLYFDCDIAERLCTPSEFKRRKDGELAPNSRETWLDVQARALFQASEIVLSLYKRILAENAA